MILYKRAMVLFLFLLFLGSPALAQQATSPVTSPTSAQAGATAKSPEINTALMETTFLIVGPSARPGEEGRARFGTGFVMLRFVRKDDSSVGQYVVVTAKHVFEDIKGDTAILQLRRWDAAGNAEPLPFTLKIRDNGRALYTAHRSADVAAIDVSLPVESTIVKLQTQITSIKWLATDKFLEDIDLHPGDELLCLGYPLGLQANDAGYPVLRSGKIASYPILPLEKANKILYDFHVEPGNSGGPVYFSYVGRPYKHTFQLGTIFTYQKIFGLVIEKADPVNGIDPSIGIIVPSIYIKETIDQLAGFESQIDDDQ